VGRTDVSCRCREGDLKNRLINIPGKRSLKQTHHVFCRITLRGEDQGEYIIQIAGSEIPDLVEI